MHDHLYQNVENAVEMKVVSALRTSRAEERERLELDTQDRAARRFEKLIHALYLRSMQERGKVRWPYDL